VSDRPLISLTMIVKNEAANLARVLESARGIADEVVVVDTGSTDRTVEIAREHGAKVAYFAWIDDFSAARNFAIEQATGDWILILDGDDVALESSPGAVRAEVAAQPPGVFFLRVPVRSPRADGRGFTLIGSRRLFRRCPQIRWHGAIHEILEHDSREHTELEVASGAMSVDHIGYMDLKHRRAERKHERNLRILRQVLAANPDDARWPYYLAKEHASVGHNATALKLIRRALRRFRGQVRPDFEGAMRCLAMNVALSLGKPALAVELGLPAMAEYAYSELCYMLGRAYAALGDRQQAERYFRLAIALRGRVAEFQIEAGAGSWKAMVELGLLAWNAGEHELGLERWRSAHEWMPDQVATNLALGQGLLATGQAAEAEPLLRRAVELAPSVSEAHLRLSQALVGLDRHQEAYDHLERLTRERPEEPRYWVWLADLLQSLGEDEAAVELLSRAVARHERDGALYERLGLSLHRLERLEDALNAFALAATFDPSSALARAGLLRTQVALARAAAA
jgi:glycosyltransferase involved in cell wall biosynthesis/lipoprotein NlpI